MHRVTVALLLLAACDPSPPGAGPPGAAPSASAPIASASASQQPAPAPPEKFDVAAIDAYVAKQVAAKELVGVSLAIVHHGEIVLAKAYGQAAREPERAATADTPFSIGSVTKQFACAAIALLAEDGKLAFDDRVEKYFPALTRAADITLADLGNHASGYRDYYPLDFVDARMEAPIAADDLIARYGGMPLDFEPGSRFSYSNTGYVMLGRVVEKVSGQPLGAFLSARVFGPLGMSGASFAPEPSEKLAAGYTTFALGDVEAAPREADGWLHAAGGIYATATDLAKWDLALVDGKVIGKAALAWMTTPRILTDGRSTQYGCGISVANRSGETVWQHSGSTSGFLAVNAVVPRTRSAVVLLSNRGDVAVRPLHDELLGLLLKGEAVPPPEVAGPPPKEIVRTLLAELAKGTLDRSRLGPDYDRYASAERLRVTANRLAGLGEPTAIDVENVGERGGMEVASLRISFPSARVRALLYRTPDGKVQELLLTRL